jgi:hypothetical protein
MDCHNACFSDFAPNIHQQSHYQSSPPDTTLSQISPVHSIQPLYVLSTIILCKLIHPITAKYPAYGKFLALKTACLSKSATNLSDLSSKLHCHVCLRLILYNWLHSDGSCKRQKSWLRCFNCRVLCVRSEIAVRDMNTVSTCPHIQVNGNAFVTLTLRDEATPMLPCLSTQTTALGQSVRQSRVLTSTLSV